jgi:hypothetical protein
MWAQVISRICDVNSIFRAHVSDHGPITDDTCTLRKAVAIFMALDLIVSWLSERERQDF